MSDDEMYEDIMKKLREFFKEDESKVILWTVTPNPMFGFMTAFDLIRCGRIKRVWQCINNAIEGNYP